MTANKTPLDSQCRPITYPPLPQAGVGIASAAVAVSFLLLGVLFRIDLLESLTFQFYMYTTAFLAALALGLRGLLVRQRRRTAAWIGLGASAIGLGWKVPSLYLVMRSCAANGWMSMPWPLW